MPLNTEQQSAVEYLEGPLLVLAGPGTGKTQLLSAKVAYILENTDTNPENILCITFTESGASNMRERLGTMIDRAAADVNIYTYHAFGSSILERYKNYAENFDRRLDSAVDGVTQYKYIHDIQQNLPVTDILKTANISDLLETIQNAKSARLTATDLKKIAEQNLSDSAEISQAATEYLSRLMPRSKFDTALDTVYQPLLAKLLELSRSDPIVQNIEPTANILARELARIIDEESAKTKPSVAPLTKWKTARFEKTDTSDFRLKDYIANKKLAALANVMEQYDQKLRADGLFDFSDMIEEAIRALRENAGFRLSLSEIFQYILLDEFQDTNPSQFEIIRLIADAERTMIMAVGDDDQAIFEFQGASASNLLDYQNYYHAKVITLLDNYRSTGEILDFSHRIAEQVDDSFAKHHHIQKVLRSIADTWEKPAAQKSSTLPTISRHEFTAANDEYYWLAQQIKQLINHGEDPENIAIIAPRHKYIAALLPYLKAEDIDIAYEKKSNLLDDPKIREIITLAEFINDLANGRPTSHRLLEILAFPFFEINPIVAIKAIKNSRDAIKNPLDYLLESKNDKLQPLAVWLARLTTISFEAPLELWLDYVIGMRILDDFRSPYLEYYRKQGDDSAEFEFYENLNALRSTVINHTKNTQPKLADFVAMINDYRAAGASIMSNSPYRDSAHSVQVMSAHKSKGLEFKYVFLIAMDELAWGKAKGNNNLFTLPSNLIQIRHTGITDDEKLRLLFVAITRAKEFLIMTNSIQDFNGKTVARLGYLNEQRDEKAPAQLSPYLPTDKQDIVLHYNDFDLDTHLSNAQKSWVAAYQVLSPNLKLILQQRLESYRLTASDLTGFIDIIYAGPEQVYQRRILCAPDEPLTLQLAYGNLIHAVFEQITSQAISDEVALQLFIDKATELPLTAHEITELQDKGRHALPIALREFRDILRHQHAKAELSLSSERPVLEGIPLTGKIDHLEIDPDNKTIEIYDFKTGNFHPEKWQSHPTLYKYMLQLGFYKLLLNLSPSYRNYKVTKGHILFVSPDQESHVYDKVYEYNDTDETELKSLVKSVHHQITSLDFVSNPELNLAPDKSRTLKDIKAFVAQLLEL